jgi:hypothetical protein
MAINKTTIIAAIGCPHLTLGKAGLHQYYLDYTNAEAGIYMERKTFHVRKLSQFDLEKWATIGKEFVTYVESK